MSKNETKGKREGSRLIFSYLEHRRTIGILGIALPVVMYVGAKIFFCTDLQHAISQYYHTGMRDVFVGILWCMGIFFLSYRGYERKDDIAGDIAAVSIIGVSISPSVESACYQCQGFWVEYAHYTLAAIFFITLSIFCIHLFTKSDQPKPYKPEKQKRNKIYRACGYTIIACIIIIGIYDLMIKGKLDWLDKIQPVFWLEAIALWAFGLSWLVKGGAIATDQK